MTPKTGRPPRLSVEAIATTAEAIVEENGIDLPYVCLRVNKQGRGMAAWTASSRRLSGGAMAEESCYFVIQVPDADRGREFYGGLLGWSFTPGSVAHSHQIEGMMGGMLGGVAEAAMKLYFDVEDVQAAAARVRELGGECGEIEETPSSYQVDCRDDQGTAFSLHQARGEE